MNFDTGVARVPHPSGRPLPPDGGFGRASRPDGGFGDGRFNIPPLVEAAGTPPFFHSNSANTLEKAVAFYTGPEFAGSPGGMGVGPIVLSLAEIDAIGAFLRVINALEDIRSAIDSRRSALATPQPILAAPALASASQAVRTAIRVLDELNLHPEAATLLDDARQLPGQCSTTDVIAKLKGARALLVDTPPDDVGPGVILTAPASSGGPVIRTFAATGQSTDFGLCAYDLAFGGGVSLAAAPVAGGGQPDIVAGAGPGGGPHVRTFARRRAARPDFFAYDARLRGGVRVAAGDVNGDGVADIVTGAGRRRAGRTSGSSTARTGGELAQLLRLRPRLHRRGLRRRRGRDGDGFADLITGAGAGGGPHVRVFSGAGLPARVVPGQLLRLRSGLPGRRARRRGRRGRRRPGRRSSPGAGPGGRAARPRLEARAGGWSSWPASSRTTRRSGAGCSWRPGTSLGDARAEIVTGAGLGGGPPRAGLHGHRATRRTGG